MMASFDTLKRIGAQKIHEDTHITKSFVEIILREEFGNLTRIQYLGFLSIIEREYHLELNELRAKAQTHFDHEDRLVQKNQEIFVRVKTPKSKKPLLIWGLVVGILVVVAFSYFKSKQPVNHPVDDKLILSATQTLKEIAEKNESDLELRSEQNTTLAVSEEALLAELPEGVKSVENRLLQIVPKSKVWIGYIDNETKSKRQNTISEPFELNASKSWLLVFGHGHLDVVLSEQNLSFSTQNNLRLLYQDNMIREIDYEEFKELNNGQAW